MQYNCRISKKQVIYMMEILLLLTVLIAVYPLFKKIDFINQHRIIAVLAIAVVAYILFSSYRYIRRIDAYMLFMGISFFFMFGQQTLLLLNVVSDNMLIMRIGNRVSQEALYNTGFAVLISFLLMQFGYVTTLREREKKLDFSNPIREKENEEKRRLMVVGKTVFFISLLPTVYVLARSIYLTRLVGYGHRVLDAEYKVSGIRNLPGILAGFMVPSLLAIYIARDRKQKWPLVVIILYCVAYVMTGSRLGIFGFLCALAYASMIQYRFSRKKVQKAIIVLMIILVAFSAVSTLRAYLGTDYDFSRGVSKVLSNNAIVSAVTEAGITFFATASVFDHCPDPIDYNYGLSYLSGIAYIVPNFVTGGFYGKVRDTDFTFAHYLTDYGGGMGSSFIAEAYFNLGPYFFILMLLYGYLLGVLSKAIEASITHTDIGKMFLFLGIFVIIVFYVRSDTRTFFRNLFWYYFLMYIFYRSIHIKSAACGV